MSYVPPGTLVKLCKGVPLDPTYEHTLYFANVSAQTQYFSSMAKYTLNDNSYQRYDRGFVQLAVDADNVMDCNYLMWRNVNHSTKWYYAFITSVEYVGEGVTKVNYEVDVMQTWAFDYTLEESFVDREIPYSDELYANLVPENLDLGDSYKCVKSDVVDLNDQKVAIFATVDQNLNDAGPWVSNNVFNGINILVANMADATTAMAGIVEAGKEDAVAAVVQFPSFMNANGGASGSLQKVITRDMRFANDTSVSSLPTTYYTPRNKKLYTYPFCYLYVSNNNGGSAEYHWEMFDGVSTDSDGNQNYAFEVDGTFLSNPVCLMYPLGYRGLVKDFDSGLALDGFVKCSWVGDAWKAYWAQNASQTITSVYTAGINSAIGWGMGAGGFNLTVPAAMGAGFIAGTSTAVMQNMAKHDDLERMPPTIQGQQTSDALATSTGRCGYSIYQMTIKSSMAKRIDSFFDRFGYKTNMNKVPNTHVRPHWTYTKTVGCNLTGDVPQDHLVKIASVFDNGVTFWRNPDEVGDYTLDNRPS